MKYNAIKISWDKVPGVAEYHIYSTNTSKYPKTYTTVGASATTAAFSKLKEGKTYKYKIVPVYVDTTGIKREDTVYYQVKETTLKKVTGLMVVKSGTEVKVSWSGVTNASGYQVYQSTKKSGSTSKGFVTAKSKNLSAKKGKTLYYKVRAYKVVDGMKIYAPTSLVKSYKLK